MTTVTVIVDDSEVDRYLVKRYLKRHADFDEIIEAETGQEFLDDVCKSGRINRAEPQPVLVLMDINMPGIDGFETAERLQEMVQAGAAPDSIVVMMFTSSDNPADKARAEAIDIVKGYIVKPLDDADIEAIMKLY